MKLTKKKAYKLHYELWDWLYENPSKQKRDWPMWTRNGGEIEEVDSDCFLCEIHYLCDRRCPLYINQIPCFTEKIGLHAKWCGAKTPKTRKKYAKLIRDIVL